MDLSTPHVSNTGENNDNTMIAFATFFMLAAVEIKTKSYRNNDSNVTSIKFLNHFFSYFG